MLDGMSIKREVSLDVSKGKSIEYVDFGQGINPDVTVEAPMTAEA